MLHELDDTTSLWLQDPVKNWREWPVAQDKALTSSSGDVDANGLLTKVNEDKLARDVDDLSAIFEELADGVIDFPLPCDDDDDEELAATTVTTTDEELTTGAVGEWLDGLDSDDALNVDEISEAFDALVAEQEQAMSQAPTATASYSASEYDDEDEDMDESESEFESDDESPRAQTVQVVPSPPVWALMAPLDPRSCIKTAVFSNLDSRIPRISIPRIDLAFAAGKTDDAAVAVGATRSVGPPVAKCLSPVRASEKTAVPAYRHDAATCWICKSSKTPEKKRALHRFLEKRSRRNWKKGPRYSGRSNVAASRVRNGGRFICTTQWI
jgi:hypothetical protein